MAQTLVTASVHVAGLATRQPRVALGATGLVLLELLAMLLGSHPIL